MSHQKLLTVITPCFNVKNTISATFASVANQTIGIENIEYILVDDASTDGGATWSILCGFEKQYSESVVAIHLDENMRQGGARNVALKYASCEYVLFLDADDELVSNACESLFHYAKQENADLVVFNYKMILGDESRLVNSATEKKTVKIETKEDRIPFLLNGTVKYGFCDKFYRLDLIKEAEVAFAEHMVYEEPPFVYPLFFYANTVSFYNEELYLYHLHTDSTVGSELGERILDHPNAQLLLLEYMFQHKDLLTEYHDEFETYFLWSFYCETIYFSREQPGAYIPPEYFREMKKICRTYFPDFKRNPYIKTIPQDAQDLMGTIDGGEL